MPQKAVFLDRDKTIIEDPGYINDPQMVRLLPGVELAIKSLRQAGFKIVLITNQSGIARGILTEQRLGEIHQELCRQLSCGGAELDAIYYCPFHPEGTVAQYAIESELRKPQPGMILKAAVEMQIDLTGSWMVGDGARDVEAGKRAGCRTILICSGEAGKDGGSSTKGAEQWTDYKAGNVVEAAKLILRESSQAASQESDPPRPQKKLKDKTTESEAEAPAEDSNMKASAAGDEESQNVEPCDSAEAPASASATASPPPRIHKGVVGDDVPYVPEPAKEKPAATSAGRLFKGSVGEDTPPSRPTGDKLGQEILQQLRLLTAQQQAAKKFSVTKLVAGVIQMIALAVLGVAIVVHGDLQRAVYWAVVALVLQIMALTFFLMKKD